MSTVIMAWLKHPSLLKKHLRGHAGGTRCHIHSVSTIWTILRFLWRHSEHRSYKPIVCCLGAEDRADLFNHHKNPLQRTLLSHSAPQGGDTVQLAARSPRLPIKANVSWSRSWLQGTLRGNRTWWHKCRKSKHSGEVDKHDDLGLTLL